MNEDIKLHSGESWKGNHQKILHFSSKACIYVFSVTLSETQTNRTF